MLFGKALATFQSLRFRKNAQICSMWGKCIPWNFIPNDVANIFRQQWYDSLAQITNTWLRKLSQFEVQSCSTGTPPQSLRWRARKLHLSSDEDFMGKILKCIQFKVKALRKSCVEMSFEHHVWRSSSVHVRPCRKKIKVQQRLDVFEVFCNLDWRFFHMSLRAASIEKSEANTQNVLLG